MWGIDELLEITIASASYPAHGSRWWLLHTAPGSDSGSVLSLCICVCQLPHMYTHLEFIDYLGSPKGGGGRQLSGEEVEIGTNSCRREGTLVPKYYDIFRGSRQTLGAKPKRQKCSGIIT